MREHKALILVTYDVNTMEAAGRRRLRRVARVCLDYGQRVQKSVFECTVGARELVILRARLQEEIDSELDALRIYYLEGDSGNKTEQYGLGTVVDYEEPLIV